MPRNYQPWSESEKERLREMCATPGVDSNAMAVQLGRSLNSVRTQMQALQLRVTPAIQRAPKRANDAPALSDAEAWEILQRKHAEEVGRKRELYDWLRPVELPAPPRQQVAAEPAPFTLVAGDFHFGMQDDRACALFLECVQELKPKRVILNGDTVDLLAVSRYPKDKRKGKTWELRDEVAAFHAFLHSLHSIGDGWGIEVVETEANHSGNGTAGRWWRYLNDRCPELLGHAEAESLLSYERWFFPKWSSIRLVESQMIADDLLVMHGDMVRSAAAFTAKASREKWMNSVLVNHTHRMGFSPKTVTAHAGRPTSYARAYENGCMCKLEVPYGVALDWQQGFAIVGEDGCNYSVEQVVIDNGRANVAALGKTLRAA